MPKPAIRPRIEITKFEESKIKREKVLGEGNFGIVYRAKLNIAKGKSQTVALKLLKSANHTKGKAKSENCLSHGPDDEKFKKARQEFIDEILIMKYIMAGNKEGMVNLMSLLGAQSQEGSSQEMGMILEYCDGNSVSNFRPQMKSWDVISMATALIRACAYLEKKRIAHMDIACRNIMISNQGGLKVYKLADYGLAHYINVMDEPEDLQTKNLPHLTLQKLHDMQFPIRWTDPTILHLMAEKDDNLKKQMFNQIHPKINVWQAGITILEASQDPIREKYPFPKMNNSEAKHFLLDFIKLYDTEDQLTFDKPQNLNKTLFEICHKKLLVPIHRRYTAAQALKVLESFSLEDEKVTYTDKWANLDGE